MPAFQDHLAQLRAPLLAAPEPPGRVRIFQGTEAQFDRLLSRNPLALELLLLPPGALPSDYVEKGQQLGNLVKKQITDSTGKRTTVWVKANGEELGSEDRQQKGQKPGQQPAAQHNPAHTPAKLASFAEAAPSEKLVAAATSGTPQMQHAAKQELAHRGVDVHAESQKQSPDNQHNTAQNSSKPAPAGNTKENQGEPTANKVQDPDSQADKGTKEPAADTPKPQPLKVAPGSAPGTPAGWDGDHTFSPEVRKAYDVNVKGIVKTVDKMVVGNAVTGIIYGEGGAGKTFNVEKTLKSRGMVPMEVGDKPVKNGYLKITGKITPKAVYEQLYRYKDNLIIFDDCDSALANEDVVNMFKGALDTGEKRMVARVTPEGAKKPAPKAAAATGKAADTSGEFKKLNERVRAGDKTLKAGDFDRWHALKTGKATTQAPTADAPASDEPEEVPNQFEFKGKVLFITNKKPNPDALQPILSRGSAHNASMNREEMLYAMSKNLPFIGVRPGPDGKAPKVPFEEREQIYGFIKDNQALFPDITMRHFGQVYEDKVYAENAYKEEHPDAKQVPPEVWQQEVKDTLEAQNKEKEADAPKPKGSVKKSFYDEPDFIEKGALKPIGTITTLRDGRKTIKTKHGWRILYGGRKTSTKRKAKVATNFEHAGKKYRVEHDETAQKLKITKANGEGYKYANSKAVKALEAAYQTQKLAEWASAPRVEVHPDMTSDDFARDVAALSVNPAEVALEWLAAPATDELSYKDAMIAEHLGAFPMESWTRFGDKNQLAGTRIKASYIKPGGTALDVQAEIISHSAGVPISEEDIVQFVMANPRGAHTAADQESELRQKLAGRFQQLTGTKVSEQLASQAAALHVVDELEPQERADIEELLYADTAEAWPWEAVPMGLKLNVTDDDDCPF